MRLRRQNDSAGSLEGCGHFGQVAQHVRVREEMAPGRWAVGLGCRMLLGPRSCGLRYDETVNESRKQASGREGGTQGVQIEQTRHWNYGGDGQGRDSRSLQRMNEGGIGSKGRRS